MVFQLERGNAYTLNLKSKATCLNCGEDITEQINGRTVQYLGILDECQHIFIYDDPPQCLCGKFQRWHVDNFMVIDVTEDFQKLLDKKP